MSELHLRIQLSQGNSKHDTTSLFVMDGHAGNFEDQFRRMVVGNGINTVPVDSSVQSNHPTVRLPPASSYPVGPQQGPGLLYPSQNGYGQQAPPPKFQHAQSQRLYPTRGSYSPQHQPQAQQHPGNHHGQPPTFNQSRGGFHGAPNQRSNYASAGQRARHQQQVALDPNAFQRNNYGPPPRGRGAQHHLFNPHQARTQPFSSFNDQQQRKVSYLQAIAASEVSSVQMSEQERDEKNAFRLAVQQVCNDVCDADPDRLPRVSLECFGSFKSGFATAGSDMDLVIVVKDQSSTKASLSLLEDDLPRALERMLLKLGYGARLLTRTRVPIIKVCEKPEGSLLSKLRAEREKWDLLPNEQKYPHLHQNDEDGAGEAAVVVGVDEVTKKDIGSVNGDDSSQTKRASSRNQDQSQEQDSSSAAAIADTNLPNGDKLDPTTQTQATANAEANKPDQLRPKREDRTWIRERKAGPLDFPKTGVGIQTDINFFNPLGLHNTQLLYCYSLCDDRVQPMVLFVKAWAKRRKINSSYSGTLSSYGYVLMVLHYLANVVSPPVIPNLQSLSPPGKMSPPEPGVEVDGWHVSFWRNEEEILAAKQRGHLTPNREPVGSLLAGFFQYYSSQGGHPQFVWTQQALSLRTPGGILTKEEKGWTKAHTEEGEGKKIQHRYLFCIEDPFELDHNVARTVTHNGIVAIRDEFRRARRVLMVVGRGEAPVVDGQLFDELIQPDEFASIAHEPKADGWQQPYLNGAPNTPGTQSPTPHATRASNATGKTSSQTPTPPKSNALNVKDNNAFPTLCAASSTKPSGKRRSPQKRNPSEGEWSEISGDKAKAVLDEVKRKKDEAQAESTALGAAQAVLGDEW